MNYDVALSFAGEQRPYVERVAKRLTQLGITHFYDKSDEVSLWGTDLVEHLQRIYRDQARHVVLFISHDYVRKAWPTHERRSALDRAIQQDGYILPARFDDAEVPGLQSSLSYLDLRTLSPEDFADRIAEKLGRELPTPQPPQETFRRPNLTPATVSNPYRVALQFIQSLLSELDRRTNSLNNSGLDSIRFDRNGQHSLRISRAGSTVFGLDVSLGGVGGDSSIQFSCRHDDRAFGSGINAWANVVPSSSEPTVELHDLSMLGHSFAQPTRYTCSQLVEALWDVLCDRLENNSG